MVARHVVLAERKLTTYVYAIGVRVRVRDGGLPRVLGHESVLGFGTGVGIRDQVWGCDLRKGGWDGGRDSRPGFESSFLTLILTHDPETRPRL
ncbi:hypothetical protein TIFTF001_027362 [Ficus carica]|uniref:Uncharacterized protein n=1 Tax=Ficus carica TaxID=3494 RepID=A0AA88DMU2_FICCA|nr:hypothetical protein TIFTF001_027362 [Ficus carica]